MRCWLFGLVISTAALAQIVPITADQVKTAWPQATSDIQALVELGASRIVVNNDGPLLVPADRSSRERLAKAMAAKDDYGIRDLVSSGDVMEVPAGTEVKVIDRDMSGVEKLHGLFVRSDSLDVRTQEACENWRTKLPEYRRMGAKTLAEKFETNIAKHCSPQRILVVEFWHQVIEPDSLVAAIGKRAAIQVRILDGRFVGKSGWITANSIGYKRPLVGSK
jgi:hypothetical protein